MKKYKVAPEVREQMIILRHRPTINEFAEDISKVRFGVDVLQLCRFDQRSNAGPVDRALIVATADTSPDFNTATRP